MDASASYKISDSLSLTLDGINLTRSVRSLYTGTENRLTTAWQDDRRVSLGLTGKF